MSETTPDMKEALQHQRDRSGPNPSSMPTVESYLKQDRGSVPLSLLQRDVRDYGTGLVDKECFISPEYHRREVEHLWSRVWQLACLEQDIPEVGDYLEYIIADQSILVVREAATRVKAYFNACRHRGSRLKVGCGNSSEIRCGFHAWAWNLDGSLKDIPCRWDFPTITDEDYRLPECKVGI